jgi:putative tricarboxylic transport membrane protein
LPDRSPSIAPGPGQIPLIAFGIIGYFMRKLGYELSAVCLALAVMLLVGPLLPALRKKREMVALDEGV